MSKRRQSQYLYFHWLGLPGAEGSVLLYLGRTNSPKMRTRQHAEIKAYWGLGIYIQVVDVGMMTDEEIKNEEAYRIEELRPPFNQAGNPSYGRQATERAQILGSANPVEYVRAGWAWVLWARRWAWVAGCWVGSLGVTWVVAASG